MTTLYRSSGSSGGVPTAALELPVASATGGSAWCSSAKTLRGLRCLGAIVGLIVDDVGTRRRAILRFFGTKGIRPAIANPAVTQTTCAHLISLHLRSGDLSADAKSFGFRSFRFASRCDVVAFNIPPSPQRASDSAWGPAQPLARRTASTASDQCLRALR
jgi:hypothetical protein